MNSRDVPTRLAGLIFLTAIFLAGCSSSNQTETNSYQCYYDYVNTKSALPEFDCKLFWSPDSSGQRLDVYVSVKESHLRFDRDSNMFVASYTCTIRVSGDVPLSKELDRRLVFPNYPGGDQNSFDAFLTSFPISNGDHSVQVSIADNESREKLSKSYSVNIPEISDKPILLSDIMLLARYDTLGGSTKITPFILSDVGLLSDTLNFFTLLTSKEPSDDSVSFSIHRLLSKEPNVPSFNIQMSMYEPAAYNPCGRDIDTILIYKQSIVSHFATKRSFVFGSIPRPPRGNYLLKILAKDPAGNNATTSLKFTVHNKNFPQVFDNLADMVSSLDYIAATNEIRKITAGGTDSLIKVNLIDFWKTHGGLSKMVQYYQRVSQANQCFTSCIEGWKTPMGMYYIVCGPPDNAECEGELDEKWNYYQSSTEGTMTVAFRLAQETENIDDRFYRIEQVYSNVDLWSYYVNQWRTGY